LSATIWALLPPIIAIVLALLTKEVYSSLAIGIFSGAMLYCNFHPIMAIETSFDIMGDKISGNIDILLFLVFLGIIVALVTKSGASAAYGNWASRVITNSRSALFATSCLGMLIFVDDYFNCLTVGTVMRPVTDRYKITRAKLAYIIDATAAPICIIAPISSWAAAVGSSLPEDSTIDGFSLFLKTIPFNFYALFTLIFVVFMIVTGIDFSKMKELELSGETGIDTSAAGDEITEFGKGTVKDLVLPILFLIGSCVVFMLYTGGLFQGENLVNAFSNCSSARSLVLGSFLTIIFIFVLYIPRKIITFNEFCDCFTRGFKAMTSAIMILCLAWTLSGICSDDYLNVGGFVSELVAANTFISSLIPFLFFLIALGLAFSTGTSWGTFGILIPIAIAVFGYNDMLVLSVAAILSGSVCGDHISPISDTTILSSAGAQCNHIIHVSTQIPYALVVACCSGMGFLVAGLSGKEFLGFLVGIALLAIACSVIYKKCKLEKI
jgi:Na+/H+ antiporter NhaC